MLDSIHRIRLKHSDASLSANTFVPLLTSQINKTRGKGDIILNIPKGQCPAPELRLVKKNSFIAAFTLIELLVTLCVAAILLILAMPSFREMLLNSRMSANSDSFVNTLNYARNTAVSQAVNVQVCPLGTLNSTTCGTNWDAGWIVVTQPASGPGTLLKSQQISNINPVLSGSTSSVVFDPQGLATTQSNFTLCDSRGGTSARSIAVLATGYVQSGATPGQAVWNNGSITCP